MNSTCLPLEFQSITALEAAWHCSQMCWARVCFGEILCFVPGHKIDHATFNTRDTVQFLLHKVIQGIVSNLLSAGRIHDSLLGITEMFGGEFIPEENRCHPGQFHQVNRKQLLRQWGWADSCTIPQQLVLESCYLNGKKIIVSFNWFL